jgi:hypothetical protein
LRRLRDLPLQPRIVVQLLRTAPSIPHHNTMAEQTMDQTWKQPVVPDKIPTGEYPVSNWPSRPAPWATPS